MKEKELKRSILKKFRKEIWSKFVKAVKEYELIKPNDKKVIPNISFCRVSLMININVEY